MPTRKKGIVHSLTDINENNIKNNLSFNDMYQLIHEHRIQERQYEREYYFIYLDKKDKTIIIRSLCDIIHFQSNPCNFLQINWTKEKRQTTTDFQTDVIEIKNRILGTIAKSVKKFVDSSNKLLLEYYPNNDFGI
jgi:hypothetical protein